MPSTPVAAWAAIDSINSADRRFQPAADRMPAEPARAAMDSTGWIPVSRNTSKAPPRPVLR